MYNVIKMNHLKFSMENNLIQKWFSITFDFESLLELPSKAHDENALLGFQNGNEKTTK